MTCELCDEEKKQDLLIDQFAEDLGDLLDKYRGNLHSVSISNFLILEAKIEMCCVSPCFYHMLGILTDFLNHDIEKMWEEMKPDEK